MSAVARKLRRELLNTAREFNVSAWLSLLKLVSLLLVKKGDEEKLAIYSEVLAHFPHVADSLGLVDRALGLSDKLEDAVHSPNSEEVFLSYCTILKPFVSRSEKGFLLVSFENQLLNILNGGILSAIQERYHIIFMPSWTGLYSPAIFRLVNLSGNEAVFILPVHAHESEFVSRLGSRCMPLPFNAASWVNQDFFITEQYVDRDIDCLMVANFASFKRHWLLFKALKGLPRSVSAVCVGVPIASRNAESIRREAKDYGVSERVSIIENPTQEDLRLYFQRAKVFCAMSYREGSFIAVAEALMSGTPVVMFENAHVGTKNLITPEVGGLVGSVSELRARLMKFLEFGDYDMVRQVARESISAQANCRKLNRMLADWSVENGLSWTKDIESFYSMRLSFYYFDEFAKSRLNSDYQYLAERGIRFSQS